MNSAINAVLGILTIFASFSASSTYKLNSYSVGGGGGTNSSTSSTYNMQASTGQLSGATSASTTYQTKSGSIQAQQANVPPAPTLSNGSGAYYNKLNFIINTGSNPSDATYSVATSTTSDFAVTKYVQTDGTLNTTAVYQTYAQWGGASGTLALGLTPETRYWFKVNAIHGKFTASAYGPSANETTVAGATPTISFALSPTTLNMGSLMAGSVVTSPSNISLTFETNAANGGTIYLAGQYTGLRSSYANYTIGVSPPSGDLSSLSEGFGLQDITASSPLTKQSPYNGSSNTVGAIYTNFQPIFAATEPISSGVSTAKLMAKSSTITPSSTDYTNTLTFIASACY